MNEREIRDHIAAALDECLADFAPNYVETITFEQIGMLTMNEGLVIRFLGGDEFQLTIVQSYTMPEAEFEPSMLKPGGTI